MKRKRQRRDEMLLGKIVLRVKELRGLYNHTQEQLKEGTGLNIANLESGDNFPNITTIAIICNFYNITLDEFFAPMHYPEKK